MATLPPAGQKLKYTDLQRTFAKVRKEKNEFRLWWSLVLCFVSLKDKS